jgi:hypothetical protein
MGMMESLWLDVARQMERGWEPRPTRFQQPVAPRAGVALVVLGYVLSVVVFGDHWAGIAR